MSNFSFSHSVVERLVSQGHQKVSLCGNRLRTVYWPTVTASSCGFDGRSGPKIVFVAHCFGQNVAHLCTSSNMYLNGLLVICFLTGEKGFPAPPREIENNIGDPGDVGLRGLPGMDGLPGILGKN